MRIAGLDLSLTSTGFSSESTLLAVQAKSKGILRLAEVRESIIQLVKENQVKFCVIEGYAYSTKNSQAHSAGELGGIIRISLFDLEIPYVDVPPTSRAKFATGRGNAGKSEVVSSISVRTGITWTGSGADDMCDAFILEEMGRTVIGNERYDWPKSHRDALSKIDWSPLLEVFNAQKEGA